MGLIQGLDHFSSLGSSVGAAGLVLFVRGRGNLGLFSTINFRTKQELKKNRKHLRNILVLRLPNYGSSEKQGI